jgi:virginiamycin A acetyltransferase
MRRAVKQLTNGIFLFLVFPFALATGFGRFRAIFACFAQSFALAPGLPGTLARRAYYRMTLRDCADDLRIEFGSFFSHPETTVGHLVGIGPYCIIGYAVIGDHTMIGQLTQILSGTQQHKRDAGGSLTDEGRQFREIKIGAHCWIGASSVVTADVGEKSTVAAGSVVMMRVPPGVVVGGNPAQRWSPPARD